MYAKCIVAFHALRIKTSRKVLEEFDKCKICSIREAICEEFLYILAFKRFVFLNNMYNIDVIWQGCVN